MAGTKDKAVIVVISDLTNEQAAQVTKEIIKAKNKYAPKGRGSIAFGDKSSVANMLQKGVHKSLERRDK